MWLLWQTQDILCTNLGYVIYRGQKITLPKFIFFIRLADLSSPMTEKNVIQIDKADKHPLDARTIQRQLSQIIASKEFHATERQREFLKFVVAETIAGRSDEIKGYAVATQVFGRSEDFDQATDPIVSIQANQLRRALERYYLVAGQNDPVRIDIPKGTYVPTFHGQIRVLTSKISTKHRSFMRPILGWHKSVKE